MSIAASRMKRGAVMRRPAQPVPPPQASEAGYNNVVFFDDFFSTGTIDMTDTGEAQFNWYTARPYGWANIQASEYKVADSVLTITQANAYANWGLATVHPRSKAGFSMKFGYTEACMRFDPSHAASSDGWPSFWAKSSMDLTGTYGKRNAELDFFEAWHPEAEPYDDLFCGGIHDWQTDGTNYHMGADGRRTIHGTAWGQWHRYGCLWQAGQCRWYLDDQVILTQQYSTNNQPEPNDPSNPIGTFAILDTEDPGMALILGNGTNWPLEVDWVAVWR